MINHTNEFRDMIKLNSDNIELNLLKNNKGQLWDRNIFGNEKIIHFAEQFLDISTAGLQRYQPHNTHLLQPLVQQISKGMSPGHELLEVWKTDNSIEHILQHLAY